MLRGPDLKNRQLLLHRNVPDPVHQHLADLSLLVGTTLEGLAQSRGHLRSALNLLRNALYIPRTWKFFEADMISLLVDMLQSSLSNFANQLKSSPGGQRELESTQNLTSDQDKEPSDHADHSEGGDLASVEDLGENWGDPKLENLMMTKEEERL